jgi:hypothetical protein
MDLKFSINIKIFTVLIILEQLEKRIYQLSLLYTTYVRSSLESNKIKRKNLKKLQLLF